MSNFVDHSWNKQNKAYNFPVISNSNRIINLSENQKDNEKIKKNEFKISPENLSSRNNSINKDLGGQEMNVSKKVMTKEDLLKKLENLTIEEYDLSSKNEFDKNEENLKKLENIRKEKNNVKYILAKIESYKFNENKVENKFEISSEKLNGFSRYEKTTCFNNQNFRESYSFINTNSNNVNLSKSEKESIIKNPEKNQNQKSEKKDEKFHKKKLSENQSQKLQKNDNKKKEENDNQNSTVTRNILVYEIGEKNSVDMERDTIKSEIDYEMAMKLFMEELEKMNEEDQLDYLTRLKEMSEEEQCQYLEELVKKAFLKERQEVKNFSEDIDLRLNKNFYQEMLENQNMTLLSHSQDNNFYDIKDDSFSEKNNFKNEKEEKQIKKKKYQINELKPNLIQKKQNLNLNINSFNNTIISQNKITQKKLDINIFNSNLIQKKNHKNTLEIKSVQNIISKNNENKKEKNKLKVEQFNQYIIKKKNQLTMPISHDNNKNFENDKKIDLDNNLKNKQIYHDYLISKICELEKSIKTNIYETNQEEFNLTKNTKTTISNKKNSHNINLTSNENHQNNSTSNKKENEKNKKIVLIEKIDVKLTDQQKAQIKRGEKITLTKEQLNLVDSQKNKKTLKDFMKEKERESECSNFKKKENNEDNQKKINIHMSSIEINEFIKNNNNDENNNFIISSKASFNSIDNYNSQDLNNFSYYDEKKEENENKNIRNNLYKENNIYENINKEIIIDENLFFENEEKLNKNIRNNLYKENNIYENINKEIIIDENLFFENEEKLNKNIRNNLYKENNIYENIHMNKEMENIDKEKVRDQNIYIKDVENTNKNIGHNLYKENNIYENINKEKIINENLNKKDENETRILEKNKYIEEFKNNKETWANNLKEEKNEKMRTMKEIKIEELHEKVKRNKEKIETLKSGKTIDPNKMKDLETNLNNIEKYLEFLEQENEIEKVEQRGEINQEGTKEIHHHYHIIYDPNNDPRRFNICHNIAETIPLIPYNNFYYSNNDPRRFNNFAHRVSDGVPLIPYNNVYYPMRNDVYNIPNKNESNFSYDKYLSQSQNNFYSGFYPNNHQHN